MTFEKIIGTSMDRVFPAGTLIGWTPLGPDNDALISGRQYVIDFQNCRGEVERSVRTYMRDRAGNEWLCFESSDTSYYPPLRLVAGDKRITITGRVVSLYREEGGEGEEPVRIS